MVVSTLYSLSIGWQRVTTGVVITHSIITVLRDINRGNFSVIIALSYLAYGSFELLRYTQDNHSWSPSIFCRGYTSQKHSLRYPASLLWLSVETEVALLLLSLWFSTTENIGCSFSSLHPLKIIVD